MSTGKYIIMIIKYRYSTILLFSLVSFALASCSGSGSNNTVTGNNAVPKLVISPQSAFNYGAITEGNSASPLEVTLTNNGNRRLDVSSIMLSDMTNYQLNTSTGANSCGTASPAIDAGSSCTVEINFNPTQTGTFPSTVEITSNDSDSPHQLSITGTSEAVAPVMNVTINQVDLATCPTVTAFVSVTDQNSFPIDGLTINDFTVLEDNASVGSLSDTDQVDVVTKPISIALVMDYSSSMTDIDEAEMESSAIDIVNRLAVDDEVEIIKFDKTVHIEQTFTTNKTDLVTAINSDLNNTGTALYDAIQQAVDDTVLRSNDRKAVIVITDGNDNNSTETLNDIIADASSKVIPVFVVALGNNIDLVDLGMITSGTSAELYESDVAQNLDTIIEQQLSEVLFTDQYVLVYTSLNTGSGTHTLEVQATKTGGFSGSDSRVITQCP